MSDEELPKERDKATNKRYESWTKHDLYQKAEEVGIEGRGDMDKDELAEALREYYKSKRPNSAGAN
ncbi:MAG: hypothetical protein WD059_00975 [Balneolaceae bacterium]